MSYLYIIITKKVAVNTHIIIIYTCSHLFIHFNLLIEILEEVALKRNMDFSVFGDCSDLVLWTIKLDG